MRRPVLVMARKRTAPFPTGWQPLKIGRNQESVEIDMNLQIDHPVEPE